MKATELMVGDWVFNLTGKPIRICGIEPREGSALPSTFLVNAYDNELTYFHLGEFEVKPIPLTVEILEKNGYQYKQDYGQYYHSILGDYSKDKRPVINIGWNPSGEMYAYDISGGNNTACCGHRALYAHELQHALRLCGLDDLADNLII